MIFTIYQVTISGNERFPYGGEIIHINELTPKAALRKAHKINDDFGLYSLSYDKDLKVWHYSGDDGAGVVIMQGKQPLSRMAAKFNALWGGESDDDEYGGVF